MISKLKRQILERSKREKLAHEERDILGENRRLKERFFSHTIENRHYKEFIERIETLLENVEGKHVLEVGSGYGDRAIALARRGAKVVGVDIAKNYVEVATTKTSNIPNITCRFAEMDCHNMTFESGYFDYVIGDAILHHLDLATCLAEICRVLRPGGSALFIEPLAGNPLLRLFRRLTPFARTVDEKPLDKEDLLFISSLGITRSEYYGLLCAPVSAMTSGIPFVGPNNVLVRSAFVAEAWLNGFPWLHPYNQFVLLNLQKAKEKDS